MTLSVAHLYHLDRQLPGSGNSGAAMALWVPSARVGVHLIDAPSAPQRKWAELIPWILEERILQPVDEMHFVIGDSIERDGKKQVAVSVVSKRDLREWLRIAENAEVDARVMVPDYLALPFEIGRISMVWHEGAFLVRTSPNSGFSAAPELAWLMIRRLIERADIAPRLSISVPEQGLIPDDLLDIADVNAAEVDWQFSAMPLSANLLTGKFKPASAELSSRAWLSTAALLVLTVVLGFGYLQLSNLRLEERIVDLESKASAGFGNVFLGQRAKPENIRSAGEKLLADLFRQREAIETPVMQGLIGLDTLMTNCECELQELVADSSELSLVLKKGAKVDKRQINIPGFTADNQTNNDLTTIRLRKVGQP